MLQRSAFTAVGSPKSNIIFVMRKCTLVPANFCLQSKPVDQMLSMHGPEIQSHEIKLAPERQGRKYKTAL